MYNMNDNSCRLEYIDSSILVMSLSKLLYNKHKGQKEIRQLTAIYAMILVYMSRLKTVASWQYYNDIPFTRFNTKNLVMNLVDLGYLEIVGYQHLSTIVEVTKMSYDLIDKAKGNVSNSYFNPKGYFKNSRVLSPSRGE